MLLLVYCSSRYIVSPCQSLLRPREGAFIIFTLTKYHRIRLNTRRHRCEEDPSYSIVQCMESYVHTKTNCSSPWDLFESELPVCKTFEDFQSLFDAHVLIYNAGAIQFQTETGCLPPCEYDDFQVQESMQ